MENSEKISVSIQICVKFRDNIQESTWWYFFKRGFDILETQLINVILNKGNYLQCFY